MDKHVVEAMEKAINTANEKLHQASYLSECGSNPGLRQMNSNKAEWLKWVVYLAERGLEDMKLEDEQIEEAQEEAEDGGWAPYKCEEFLPNAEIKKLLAAKDAIIEDLTDKLKSLQLT